MTCIDYISRDAAGYRGNILEGKGNIQRILYLNSFCDIPLICMHTFFSK